MSNKGNDDFDDVSGGFEFDPVPEWDANGKTQPATKAEKTSFDDDFSSFEFGGTDTNNDDVDGGFDFKFDAMPTEQSVTAEQHRGDPSAEFEEFGVSDEGFPVEEPFRSASSFEEAPLSAEETEQFDEFEEAFRDDNRYVENNGASDFEDATSVLTGGHYVGAEQDDLYNEFQQPDDASSNVQTAQASPKSPQSLVSKLIVPVGVAATVLVSGYVGYNFLFSSTAPAPATVAEAPAAPEPQFPTSLPGTGTDVALATDTAPAPSVPEPVAQEPVQTLNPPMSTVDTPQELTFELPSDATDATPTAPVEMPVPGTIAGSNDLPVAPQEPEVAVALPEVNSPAIPQTPVASGAAPVDAQELKDYASKSELADVLDRLASLEAKVDQLAESAALKVRAEDAGTLKSAPQDAATTAVASASPEVATSGLNANALPVASVDTVNPPLKPMVIRALTLVGVSGETAWVKSGDDVLAIKKGDKLPTGGQVEDIRQYRGTWVLVATDGIVLR